MQLGLYLPGLSALSGVQSLRILDRYQLLPAHFPESTVSVHGEGDRQKPIKAGFGAVVTLSHAPDDAGELLEVRLLRREQWVALEERDHAFEQCLAVSHHEDKRSIRLLFGLI
jgi:hypothetical protein